MSSNTEELIDLTGGCGLFQIIQVTAARFSLLNALWAMIFMSFASYNPGWTCTEDDSFTNNISSSVVSPHSTKFSMNYAGNRDENNNSSFYNYNNQFQSVGTGNHENSSSFYNYNSNNQFQSSTIKERVDEFNCSRFSQCSSIKFNPYGKTIVTDWALACDRQWIVSLIISLQMVGMTIITIPAGWFSERFGKNACVYGSLLLLTICNYAMAFSTSWQMLAVMRFISGLGIGGVFPTAAIISLEFLNSKWRGIVEALPYIGFGQLTLALIVYLEQDWRMVQITLGIMGTLTLLTYFWIPESMRWLAVKGKVDEAKTVVVKMAKYNKTAIPDMSSIDAFSKSSDQTKDKTSIRSLCAELFGERRRVILMAKTSCLLLFELTCYHSLSLSIEALPGNFYANFFIFSGSDIPAILLTGVMANRFGRVKGCAFYSGLGALASACALVFSLTGIATTYPLALIILPIITRCLISGMIVFTTISIVELCPTNIRAISINTQSMFSRVGSIVAPFLSVRVLSLNGFLMMLSVILLLAMCIALSLPETKNRHMPDVEQSHQMNSKIPTDSRNAYQDPSTISQGIAAKSPSGIHLTVGEGEFDDATIFDSEKKSILPANRKHYN